MKIAPFRLLSGRKEPPRPTRDDTALIGLAERDLSPRARAKLVDLIGDFNRMSAEAERLKARIAELEALADTDPLADVMNRRAFVRELAKALAFAERHGGAVSVLYLDLKAFKAINDTHGHRVGDAAIVHVSEFLKARVRETDTVGRLGGDEFGVILPHADADQARAKADQLVVELAERPLSADGAVIALDMSVGVYEAAAGDDAETMLRHADAAMYAHKKTA